MLAKGWALLAVFAVVSHGAETAAMEAELAALRAENTALFAALQGKGLTSSLEGVSDSGKGEKGGSRARARGKEGPPLLLRDDAMT